MDANDKPLNDLIDVIHFTENVASKIHGVLDEAKIYAIVKDEFAKSKRHTAIILLLTDDGSHLQIAESSIASELVKKGEKASGLRMRGYQIDLDKSSIYSQVVREGKTVQVNTSDIIGELFPRAIASLISKVMGYEKRPAILTPLKQRGEIIGALAMSSTELAEHFIPSVRSLAQHISTALEMADEHTERVKAEEAVKESEQLHLELFQGISDGVIVFSSEGRFLKCNDAMLQLLGYSNEEFLQLRATDIVHPDFHQLMKDNQKMIWAGETTVVESMHLSKDGRNIPVEIHAHRIEYLGEMAILAVVRDITEWKQAQEELNRLNIEQQTIMDSIPAIIFYKDRNDRLVRANKVFADTLNTTVDDVIGKTTAELYPQQAEEMTQDDREVITSGKPKIGIIEPFTTPKGTRWAQTDKVPYRDSAGNIIGVIGIVQDITQQVQAEQALRESEQRFDLAVSGSSDGFWDRDPITDKEWWSPLFYELLGYEDGEIKSSYEIFTELLHPEDRDRAVKEELAHLKKRVPFDIQYRLLTKSGEYRWFRARAQAIWDENDNPIRIAGSIQDITERLRIENDLKQSEERFRDLIEKAGIGIAIDDAEGNHLYVNQTFADIHGYTIEEIHEQPIQSLTHPDDVERVLGYHVARIQGQEAPSRYEFRGVRKDGSIIHLEVDVVLLEEGGRATGTRTYLWDISDRVQAEEALKEYSEQLEAMVEERTQELRDAQEQLVRREKLAALGQMAGGVAHELRGPLAVINNSLYILRTDVDDRELAKEYIEMIQTEVHNSEKIISDLLEFSRVKVADREQFAVADLVDQALVRQLPPESVEVVIEISDDLPLVFVDPQQIRQVLINLVSNAYDAMPDGGELTIEAQVEDDMVHLSFSDTGCGISEEDMSKIFEPLFTTKERGIGLGLVISKSLVEANSGMIKVESDGVPGRGSTFTVRLPTGIQKAK